MSSFVIFTLFLYHPDINECFPSGLSSAYQHLAHICHDDANCTNTKGSYYCGCLVGYSGDGVICEGGMLFWHFIALFYFTFLVWQPPYVNVSYLCSDWFSDIDECLTNPCLNNGTCYNRPGSYECKCTGGYDSDNCENGESLPIMR